MANPQRENGHLDIANELVKFLAKTHLSGNEHQIIYAVWIKTWCWHKKKDWISLTQLEKLTGLNRVAVCRSKKLLVSKMILVEENGKIGLNKDYDQWVVSKTTLVSKTAIGSVKKVLGGSVKNDTYKRNYTKETNTKESMFSKIKTKKGKPLPTPLTGDNYKPDFNSPLKIKIERRHEGSEFGRKCVWLGYRFDEMYFKRFNEHYKKGSFSVSGIAKNISKYDEFERDEWIKIIEFYFNSKKSQELVVTLESCFSENSLMEYKQKNKNKPEKLVIY